MLGQMESRWRYPLATVLGIGAGGYIGAMVATIYVVLARRERLETISFAEPWFLRYEWWQLQTNPAMLQAAVVITGAGAFALAVVGLTSAYRGRLTEYDDAHFQPKTELRRNRMVRGFDANGFVYGKLGKPSSNAPFVSAPPDRFPHAMMVAPTGRGKGVGFVLPNLLHHHGSAVVLDVKGENFEKTAHRRGTDLKNAVWYFSPFAYVDVPKPEGPGTDGPAPGRTTRTHRFNPLARIAAMDSTEERYTALNALADLFLIVESDSARGFYQAGKRLFVACCLYAIEQDRPTLGYAAEVMGGGGARADAYRQFAERTAIPIVARTFNEMAGETQKIVDSYVSVIMGAGFELWSDPSVVQATSESDFDFADFRREAQTLYIAVQPEHLRTLAPLVRLLFADAIASLQRAEPGPDEPHAVMFLMDEFDQLGRQEMVLNAIKTIRSYGGRFFIISQTIPGLDAIYGEAGRRSLMGGAGIQIFMTPQDDRTAEVISGALGKRTIISKTESQSRIRDLDDSANVSRRNEERPLVSPSELLRFPLDEVLILPEGQYPIRAQHIRYYEDRQFAPLDRARQGRGLPWPPLGVERVRARGPARMTRSGEEASPASAAPVANTPRTEDEAVVQLAAAGGGFEAVGTDAATKSRSKRRPRMKTGAGPELTGKVAEAQAERIG